MTHDSKMAPLFSIVIPTYNHGHLIGRCLDSVVGQSYGNWEAIVVNNFSEDNTIEVVERYDDPRIKLINFANNGIIAASRNKGISEARGEWICFLDSDDWWTPDKLEACLPYLDDNDLIYHRLQEYHEGKGLIDQLVASRTGTSPLWIDILLNGNFVSNSTVVVRRSVVEAVGLLTEDKTLVAVEDCDYWLRIARYTERFVLIDRILGYYYIAPTSISAGPKWVMRHDALYSKYIPLIEDIYLRRKVEKNYLYRRAIMCNSFGMLIEARRSLWKAFGTDNSWVRNIKILYRLAGLPTKNNHIANDE